MMNLAAWKPFESFFQENWALLAIFICLTAMLARHLLMRDCIHAAKSLGKDNYKLIMHQYTTQSLPGWLLIVSSVVLAEALLAFPNWLPLWTTRRDAGWVTLLAFMSGVLLHIRALHLATVSALKERADLDKAF